MPRSVYTQLNIGFMCVYFCAECWFCLAVTKMIADNFIMSHVVRKPVFGVSNQVRHKPGCSTTEDGLRLEISDLGSTCRGIVLSMKQKQRR